MLFINMVCLTVALIYGFLFIPDDNLFLYIVLFFLCCMDPTEIKITKYLYKAELAIV
jgi:hypothetical protein